MLALDPGSYAESMSRLAGVLPEVRGIVAISAHWTADRSIGVTASRRPEQIYDFAGFLLELYRVKYRPRGDSWRAGQIVSLLEKAGFAARLEPLRGLDHGVWVPLRLLYPRANVPVVQVALPHPAPPQRLLAMGKALAPLRQEGILLLASGGLVHNFEVMQLHDPAAPAQPWAVEFEQWMLRTLHEGDHEALAGYREQAPFATLAAAESEHLDPLFVAAGAAGAQSPVTIVHQDIQFANLSLLSFAFGMPSAESEASGAAH